MSRKNHLIATGSQTLGPFFHLGLTTNKDLGKMAAPDSGGEAIRVAIRILDGKGNAVPDAMVEIWQADANGKYDHPEDNQEQKPDPAFCGFGRLATDEDGWCLFETVRPGRVPGPNGQLQAPHLNLTMLGRGILAPLFTRLYFTGDPANDQDEILRLVPSDRVKTLLASRQDERPGEWQFLIHLCGPRETIFFDW